MPNHPEISDDYDPAAFMRWLEEYPRGMLGAELAEALAQCVNATRLHDKTSTFALKVTIAPGNQGLGDLQVQAKVDSKPAKPTNPVMTFFPTEGGGLSRRDPNQPTLPGVTQ